MRSYKTTGFTLVEMLVSLAIMGLLAVTVVVNMNSGKRTEELRNAARQMAADIRSMQSRALSAGEVKACLKGAVMMVCENSTVGCTDPAQCSGSVPADYGVMATTSATGYVLFAEVEPSTVKFWMDSNDEMVLRRPLLPVSNQDVEIQKIETWTPPGAPATPAVGSIGFMRQSGTARFYDGTGTEPTMMKITLRHKLSNAVLGLEINRVTGRVSILN
jgi:prepilin-type N-terminal cleavage/methylation domain-containing protein